MNNSALPRGRRHWRTIVVALVLFVSGIVVGGSITALVIIHRARALIREPALVPDRLAGRLTTRLSLTPEQHEQVLKILRTHQERLLSMRTEVQPRVMRELDSMRDDISNILEPGQKQRWTSLYVDFVDNWLPPLPTTSPTGESSR